MLEWFDWVTVIDLIEQLDCNEIEASNWVNAWVNVCMPLRRVSFSNVSWSGVKVEDWAVPDPGGQKSRRKRSSGLGPVHAHGSRAPNKDLKQTRVTPCDFSDAVLGTPITLQDYAALLWLFLNLQEAEDNLVADKKDCENWPGPGLLSPAGSISSWGAWRLGRRMSEEKGQLYALTSETVLHVSSLF